MKHILASLVLGLLSYTSFAGGFAEVMAPGSITTPMEPSSGLSSPKTRPGQVDAPSTTVQKPAPPEKGSAPKKEEGGKPPPGKRADDDRQRRIAQHFSGSPPEPNRFERVPHVDATAQMVGLFLRLASVSLSRW